ncbi:MAG: hypothetical protein CMI73_03515 [Candidatus Pelagibacter sp.]|nr:hypothetical protein [Candidatus Pelagibacter sp.]OUV86910.1 MAG: hypothetical protein CBC96_03445 [Pelagibacteraceae bacterium TMED136]
MKKILISLVILLSLKCNVYAKTELKIGAILPLSGEHQLLGKNIYQSILITIFELKNLNIKVIPLDTQSTISGAKSAFQKGVDKEVDIFVGPIFFNTLNVIKNLDGFKDKVFFSYSNKENSKLPNVINFGVNLSSQINALSKIFNRSDKYIFFGDSSSFTKKVLDKTKIFKSKKTMTVIYKDFKEINLKAKKITNFVSRNNKHKKEIKRLEKIQNEKEIEKSEDALLHSKFIQNMKKHDTLDKVKFKKVFLSSYNEELIASLSYFDFYDANYKDVQFITLNLWFEKKYLNEPSLENVIFPSINFKAYQELNQKYRKNFDRDIYHLEVLTFDMIPLIAATWFSSKEERFKTSMFNGTYKGKSGNFSIKENKANRTLILYKIEKKKFKRI